MSHCEYASRFTLSIIDVGGSDSLNGLVTNQSVTKLLTSFKNAIELKSSGSGWGLRLILPFANELSPDLIDSIYHSGIEVDLIDSGHSYPEKLSALIGKQIVYPNHRDLGSLNDQFIRTSIFELSQNFSDLVVIVGISVDTPLVNLYSFNRLLVSGKPILVMDTSGSMSLFSTDAISANDRSMLARSPKAWKDLSKNSKAVEMHEAVSQSLHICLEQSADQRESLKISSAKVAKWVGRLDGLLMSLYSGLGWGEVKKSILKNPLDDYFGVSVHDMSEGHKDRHPIKEPGELGKSFSDFDIAANYYSGCYRDTNWLLYSLSAFAVFAAVAGGISLGGEAHSWLWSLAECVSILGMVSLVWLAKTRRFHQNWLTNRFCAEVIRYARVGLPFLLVPYGLKQVINLSSSRDSAIPEMVRVHRLLIDSGLPHPSKEKTYVPLNHFDELVEYAIYILSDQMNFHKKTSHRNHHMAHRMHQISYYCFFLTVFAILGHFIIHTDNWLIFTAALPALAGAIHGLGTQNEYERVAQISAMAYERLHAAKSTIEDLAIWRELDGYTRFTKLQLLMSDAVDVMSGSARSWQEIIQARGTTLPA